MVRPKKILDVQDEINRIADSDECDDFLEYSALVASCKLIITTDTTVAHLAGSMGVPTWIFLPKIPDWRWGLHGDKSFWYPSVRLFRQKNRGSWAHEMEQVIMELKNI